MKDARIRWDGKRLKIEAGMLCYRANYDGTITATQIVHACEDGVTLREVNTDGFAFLNTYSLRYLTRYLTRYTGRTKAHALRKRIAEEMRDVRDYTRTARFHANRARRLRKLLATTED